MSLAGVENTDLNVSVRLRLEWDRDEWPIRMRPSGLSLTHDPSAWRRSQAYITTATDNHR